MISRVASVILVLSVFCLSVALADDGGSSSGGTTFSKDTEKTLDSSTFEVPFDPRQEFGTLLNRRTYPLIEKIRSRLPVLGGQLQQVFSQKIWWKTSQTLIGRPAHSRIAGSQQLIIDQDDASVLVSASFWKKKPEEQNTALIHEAIRFIAIKEKLKLSDTKIQLITRMLENADRFRNEGILRDTILQAGLGYFLTTAEVDVMIAQQKEMAEKFCVLYRTHTFVGRVSEELRVLAKTLSASARQTAAKHSGKEVYEVRPGVPLSVSYQMELEGMLEMTADCLADNKRLGQRGSDEISMIDACRKAYPGMDTACALAKDQVNAVQQYDDHNIPEPAVVLGTVLGNSKANSDREPSEKISEQQKKPLPANAAPVVEDATKGSAKAPAATP